MWIARRAWVVALPSVLILVGTSSAGAAGRAQLIVGLNRNTSQMTGNQAETTIAINPTNPRNVVVVSNIQFGGQLFKSYTFDGGRTWHPGTIADGTGGLDVACCDPSMAFDSFGNLFLVYLDSNAHDVELAISTDGGVTFQPHAPIRLSAGSGPARSARGVRSGPGVDQPTLVTGDGTVWADWKIFNGKHTGIEASGAAVAGLGQVGPFSAPELAPGSKEGSFGDIVVGPNGEVMVVYQDNIPSEGPSNMWVNVDPDGLGPAGFGDATAVGTTNVGGFDFIPPQSTRSVDAETGLAWDRSGGPRTGRVYLLYTDEIPDESNDTDIFVRHSDNAGHTWSDAVRVNDDATTNSQFNPRIALDQTSGAIAVSWHDARDDQGDFGPGDTNGIPNDDAQFWASASVDGGQTFLPNVRVSGGTSNGLDAHNGVQYGDYTGLAFFGSRFYPSWADNSNSTGDNPDGALDTFDVYTARVVLRA